MPRFGRTSTARLKTCHKDIQRVLKEAIKVVDFSVLEGHRGRELQNLYYSQGKSKLRFPKSKHNKTPSRAVDIVPYPIDWNDSKRFILLAGIVLGIAHKMGVGIRWGGDWNRDFKFNESFFDAPHFELWRPRSRRK